MVERETVLNRIIIGVLRVLADKEKETKVLSYGLTVVWAEVEETKMKLMVGAMEMLIAVGEVVEP